MSFFSAPDLVRPRVSPGQAARLASREFGISGTVRELGSQQDRNFLVTGPAGRYVLKVPNPAFSEAELDAQDAALTHLQGLTGIDVPRVVPALGGTNRVSFAGPDGPLRARLLSYVDGVPLGEADHLAPVVVRRLGELAGRIAAGLADLSAPGLDRVIQWDVRQARAVCELLAPHLPTDRREVLLQAATAACDRLDELAGDLRVQPVHGDVTDDNVVCARDDDGRPLPTGVIDFGDVAQGWVVGDLAATCASVLHHVPGRPLAVLPAIQGYDRSLALTEEEIDALWPAIVARTAVLVVSGVHQGVIDPSNEYAVGAQQHEWDMFEAASSLPLEVGTAAVRAALGRAPKRTSPWTATVPLLPTARTAEVLDFSVLSPQLREANWLEPDIESRLATPLVSASAVAVARYGEARLTRTREDSAEQPATVALGVEIFGPPGAVLHAPVGGVVRQVDDRTVLTSGGLDLVLSGATATTAGPVDAGDVLGEVPTGRLLVQLCGIPGLLPPAFVPAETTAAWQTVCPDPTGLLGLDVPAVGTESAEDLLARRHDSLARVQEHYYAQPPRIERGWRHHLMDTDGRTYLDAVNNVASVGHAHPTVLRAAAAQAERLNTNSRFLYSALPDFADRLAALLPEPLDTVFLVNSGSEAVDLALRLSAAFTGREDVLCIAEAYHGWTASSDAVSTSLADNPQALTNRPAWVHPLPVPHPVRGRHTGPGAAAGYLTDARADIEALASAGRPVGAVICEAVYGNAGGIPLPDGYLAGLYELVRAAGGVCIADEVQVGYGRLGKWFWGFQQQGVVPDVVTVAKAMGNGHPLGAVITRRDIADAYARNGYFFSSAGGSPVSCAVGSAVLDVLEGEALQANARDVGAHLRSRFEALAEQVPLIGAVHGLGLYLGVELVRDRATFEPATRETAAICDRLLELGVVLQATGDRLNILKIKPPMCLSRASADFFADRVAEVLLRGW